MVAQLVNIFPVFGILKPVGERERVESEYRRERERDYIFLGEGGKNNFPALKNSGQCSLVLLVLVGWRQGQ